MFELIFKADGKLPNWLAAKDQFNQLKTLSNPQITKLSLNEIKVKFASQNSLTEILDELNEAGFIIKRRGENFIANLANWNHLCLAKSYYLSVA